MEYAMKIIALIFVLFLQQLFTSISFAQGEAAVPFLLMPTNAEMNGMGYASVAHITDNPAALIANPAHLGMQCLNNSIFTVSENYSNWLPTYHLDLWTHTTLVNAGINLNKIFPNLPPLSVGVSYSNVDMNFGEFSRTGPDSPDPLGTFKAHDESSQFSLSIATDYYVLASLGLTFKHVNSVLSNQPTAQENGSGKASADMYDVGFLLDVPFVPIISKIVNQPIPVYNNLSPIFNFSFGISESNISKDYIYYIDKSQADPLPRFARAGIELNLGVKYVRDNISWVPFSFKWTIEANDLLVTTDSSGYGKYQSGLGDINFFREVILGKTNKETEKLKGWELNLGETIYIYGGRFIEDPDRGNRNFTSGGYAVSLSGLFKTLEVIKPGMFEGSFMKYVVNHVGLKFIQSIVNTIDISAPLNDTKYYSLNFSFNNWL
jgi:hypothetical protein